MHSFIQHIFMEDLQCADTLIIQFYHLLSCQHFTQMMFLFEFCSVCSWAMTHTENLHLLTFKIFKCLRSTNCLSLTIPWLGFQGSKPSWRPTSLKHLASCYFLISEHLDCLDSSSFRWPLRNWTLTAATMVLGVIMRESTWLGSCRGPH